MIPTVVLLHCKQGILSYRDVCLYGFLLAKQGNKDKLWFSIPTLEALTGINRDSIKQSLTSLKAAGHVKRSRRLNKSSLTYCLTRVVEGGNVLIGQPAPPKPALAKDEPSARDG